MTLHILSLFSSSEAHKAVKYSCTKPQGEQGGQASVQECPLVQQVQEVTDFNLKTSRLN